MEEQLTPAERMYKRHLRSVSDYQRRHPEKMKAKYKERMERIREDPVEYALFKQRRREYDRKFRENKKKKQADAPLTEDLEDPVEDPPAPPRLDIFTEVLGEVSRVNKRVFSRK